MLAAIEHGYLPSGKYIFNHDIMHYNADGVVGNQFYSSRALGITEPWDHIQLHPDLKPMWNGISSHYKRIGLSHSSKVIWELDPKHLAEHIGYEPSVFYYGTQEHKNWGDNRWLATVDYINCKNNFIALAKELDALVPKTECFNSVSEIDLDTLGDIHFPCYLKAAVSVSGGSIYRCKDRIDLIQAMKHFAKNVPLQVQEEINADSFLNIQYRVTENDVIRLATSEQIPDGFVHHGNHVPASHELWRSLDTMAYWLKEMGMQGIFSFDVAVMHTEHGLRFPIMACNPRFNGATYPTLIAQKLDIPEWTVITMSTRYKNLEEMDIRDIEFNHQTTEGVIIVNWGTIMYGKLELMLAGSPEYQEALAGELEARL